MDRTIQEVRQRYIDKLLQVLMNLKYGLMMDHLRYRLSLRIQKFTLNQWLCFLIHSGGSPTFWCFVKHIYLI